MNSVPDTDPASVKVWLMVFIAIVSVIVLTLVISGRRSEIAGALAKFLVVGVLMLVIAGFFWSRGVQIQTNTLVEPEPMPIHLPDPPIDPAALESPSSPTAGELESAKPDVVRPEWTRQSVRIDGGRKLIVVSSGRFASEEEAMLHGFQQAAATVVKEYSSLDPRGIGAVQPQHADLVKDTAIKDRFMETAVTDFGKFKGPNYQLWLQVELTPELGERLAEPWRQAAVEARLRTLTGWSLWSTAAAALAAFALRLDAAWNGRRRAVIAGTAIALTLGSLAILG